MRNKKRKAEKTSKYEIQKEEGFENTNIWEEHVKKKYLRIILKKKTFYEKKFQNKLCFSKEHVGEEQLFENHFEKKNVLWKKPCQNKHGFWKDHAQ